MIRFLFFCLCVLTTLPVVAQHDYKVSRKLLREKKFDEAEKVLNQKIRKQPGDSEWVYQLAIAQANLGNRKDAWSSLQKAIEMGVHPGRAVADSHDLLKPLRADASYLELLNDFSHKPAQGPMMGDLTESSVRIWLRTAYDTEAEVQVYSDSGARVTSAKTIPTRQQDYVANLKLEGLAAGQSYRYRILIGGEVYQDEYEYHFKTPGDPGTPAKFKLAFGGGAGYVAKHERMWDTIRAKQPDMLLLLGDNMYSDDPQSSQMQRFCYYRRQSPAQYRQLTATTPVYTIWDDHDFGTNDCSGGPAIDHPGWKIPVWNVFRQNWANPAYGMGASQPGCWYQFTRGNVQFFMLDGRYYRDQKGGTMLGPVQKKWLKGQLAKSTAVFKVLVSPVPWEYRTKGESKDTWNGFKAERSELFDFLTEKKISGVLLMSADRHRSDAWKIDRPDDYALYEFNSSRLTNNHVHPTMKEAIFSYNKKQSFGLVQFDTTQSDPTVRYAVINIDGEEIDSLTIKRSQLE